MTVTRRGRLSPCAYDRQRRSPLSIGCGRQLCYRCQQEVERQMNADRPIGVAGGGSNGRFVGGRLGSAGRPPPVLRGRRGGGGNPPRGGRRPGAAAFFVKI